MLFFVALLVDGILAGSVYALVALAFVVVYRTSRIINFCLGEWVTFASRLVGTGMHALALPLVGALAFASAGMAALAVTFNRAVLHRLIGQPPISLVMVTIGFGAVLQASTVLFFPAGSGAIALPVPSEPIEIGGLFLVPGKLVAAAAAGLGVLVVASVYRTRTGLALRAIADDPQAAMATGIDVDRHVVLTWSMAGAIAVVAGTLSAAVWGGGLSLVLIGLKVFPIVVVGGMDSLAGTVVGALLIGVLESEAAGYLNPLLGAGFSSLAPYLVLLGVLLVRPHGLFGTPRIERV
ncbi:MAG TPA: branched-chain amino acid ABC transporter permease [Methylomirabilota bacterium]|jgi:branched-chain amino acid transport system permease protein